MCEGLIGCGKSKLLSYNWDDDKALIEYLIAEGRELGLMQQMQHN
jgi:hypothetical protein